MYCNKTHTSYIKYNLITVTSFKFLVFLCLCVSCMFHHRLPRCTDINNYTAGGPKNVPKTMASFIGRCVHSNDH